MSTYRETKETLRTRDDQWFAIIPLHLPPQEMEVLRRSSGECDVHVDMGGLGTIMEGVRVIRELQDMVRTSRSAKGWNTPAACAQSATTSAQGRRRQV